MRVIFQVIAKMANIAILSFYSGVVDRGVETFAYELAKRLSKTHKITIFQGGQTIQNPQVRTNHISAFAAIPKSSNGLMAKIYLDVQSIKILLFTLKCIPKVIKGRYDVVIPLNGGWQTVLIKSLSVFAKFKILISGHAGIGSDDAWNLYFHPDVFIALTSSEKTWAQKLTNEVAIETIPNGVDLSKFHPKIMAKKIELKKPIVICTSALDSYKRIDLTIKAVAKTKDLSLLILGDGHLRGYLDSLGKRLLANRYQRLTVPYKETPSYYKAGDVFTLVSKTEAFGNSYLEAMACNLPVVATCDESRREIIGDAGILTDPENLTKYAKDLEIASLTNYRNIPYNQALKFSWNKVAAEYSKVLKKLTN